jgi:hypothetical protein
MAPGIETDAEVSVDRPRRGRLLAFVLDNGETIPPNVSPQRQPKLLYAADASDCHSEFLGRIGRWRNGSGTFRMMLALAAPVSLLLPGLLAIISPPASRISVTLDRAPGGSAPRQLAKTTKPVVEVPIPRHWMTHWRHQGHVTKPVLPASRRNCLAAEVLGRSSSSRQYGATS